jgi:hypothetical protein
LLVAGALPSTFAGLKRKELTPTNSNND